MTPRRKTEEKGLSRRELIIRAGTFTAGAAIASAGVPELVSKAEAKRPAKHPWGYTKLDPKEVGQIAYDNWYKNFCCYAVASGILIPLQKKIGEPYTLFPLESTVWGHGGAVGWGTLCGSLNGAGIATGLIAGKDGEKIINDVIAWYTQSNLPIFKPANPRAKIKNVNRSNSPLCHISVGKWMKKEGVAFLSPGRRERCARLSADIAMYTVKLLNARADGKYKPSHGSQVKAFQITSQNNCMECHQKGIPSVPGV
jgi:hypothetical protein